MKVDRAFAKLEEDIQRVPNDKFHPDAKKQIMDKVKETKEEVGPPAYIGDKWIYRYVVWFLGIAILGCLFFTFYLSVKHTGGPEIVIPDIFLAIGSAAVGALAGLLAPSPTRDSNA
jgi:hypothetical protein